MKILTNGCSWTWGGGLEPWMKENNTFDHEKRLGLVWPHHLGKLLSAEQVTNLAEGCGSNQRTVRTTYDWLTQQTSADLSNTVAIIQITNTARFELYEPLSTDQHENIPGQWIKCKWDLVTGDFTHQSKFDPKELLQKARQRIADTHNIEDIYRNITYLYALDGMFRSFGLKQWYFWHIQGEVGWQNDFAENNFDNFVSHFNILDYDNDWEYERLSKEDTHPSIMGHHQLANIIYKLLAVKT